MLTVKVKKIPTVIGHGPAIMFAVVDDDQVVALFADIVNADEFINTYGIDGDIVELAVTIAEPVPLTYSKPKK